MELTIARADLAAALTLAGKIAYKGPIPIYQYVLLHAAADALVVSRTNGSVSVVATITCDVPSTGALAVPQKLLADVLAGLRDDRITLRAEGTVLSVIGAAGKAKVKGMDPAEFPALPTGDVATSVLMPAATICAGIDRTKHAAATDTTRPNLTALLLRLRGDQLTMVGCDSFRLAVYRAAFPGHVEDIDLLVPLDALTLVRQAFGESKDAVTIAVNESRSQVSCSDATTRITATLLAGQYVEFQRVIDQTARHDLFASVNTKALLEAARFTNLIARDALHTLRVELSNEQITLHARANQVGEDDIAVPADTSAEGHVYLDNVYLTQALGAVVEARVQVSFTPGDTLPFAIRPVGEVGSETLHVIMPMHMKEPAGA